MGELAALRFDGLAYEPRYDRTSYVPAGVLHFVPETLPGETMIANPTGQVVLHVTPNAGGAAALTIETAEDSFTARLTPQMVAVLRAALAGGGPA